ncbi:BRCT domain containing protein [Parasponia andersonii]|uniref:BRCT domain containing protein n=1 Tax=Parasponia andersonii TaxID=3476 RepID=A0A2P5DIK2_PARAD|nr:BRCT domain containing protein [Parasponia andersonii]
MVGGGVVEVVKSKGCSRLLVGISSPLNSFKGLQPVEPRSPASSSVGSERVVVRSAGPFNGLVICVTGLSKEARKQVMEATERLGGHFGGPKFEHALKHGSKNGLFIVTLGWFVDSVRKNVRLSESLYRIKSLGENKPLDEWNRLTGFTGAENSCLPVGAHGTLQSDTIEEPHVRFSGKESDRNYGSTLSGRSMFVDLDISAELRNKVIEAASREGAKFVDQWFAGCNASYVVCEGSSIRRYLGHSSNLVTPLWVLKTAKEKYEQRLVHMSTDLARQVNLMLEDFENSIAGEVMKTRNTPDNAPNFRSKANYEERQQIANSAKIGVRNRRGRRMQTCQTPMRPITPNSLLDSICWSISEPTSTASIYTDSFSSEDVSEHHTSQFFDAKGDAKDSEASFAHLTRSLTESDKSEVVFRNHFLTILFPVDRFSEMGPSSRTFFSDDGFTCLQVLEHVHAFYQENMSAHEIEAAIHTDSRHADRLRSIYSSKETVERGYVIFKRIEFLGSRRSFEMLKRVNGDNNSNVYELLIRA